MLKHGQSAIMLDGRATGEISMINLLMKNPCLVGRVFNLAF